MWGMPGPYKPSGFSKMARALAQCPLRPQNLSMPPTPPTRKKNARPPALEPNAPAREPAVSDTAVEPRLELAKPPSMYQVLLLNDDFTPMEFVVLILQEFFNKDQQAATTIMYKVHTEGRGLCGIYTRDIAQTKVQQVMEAARASGHPLQCVCEPVQE